MSIKSRTNVPLKRLTPASIRGRDAFTLLEILIAITMTGLILGTLLGVFTGIMSSSANASKRAELYQTGRAVMDMICADIRGFIPLSTLDGKNFFQGVSATYGNDEEQMRLDLITTHTLSIGIEQNPFLSEVGYHVKKNRNDPLYTLWRRAEYPPSHPFNEGGSEVPICRILESFRLEFVDNNGTKHNLIDGVPEAVVLSFTLNLEGEREQFVTMVRPIVRPWPSEPGPSPR